jgi:hypothetical protein
MQVVQSAGTHVMEIDVQADRRAAGSIRKPHPPGTGTLASDAGGGVFLA